MSISDKRKKITEYLLTHLKMLEPGGTNAARYEQLLSAMSDEEFSEYMDALATGKVQLHIFTPNLKVVLKVEDILKTAKSVQVDLCQRVWLTDKVTGKKYLSVHAYPILQLPIRRVKQYLLHKISVPTSDKTIDALTGQVTGDDRSSSISQVELQALYARGLKNVILEFAKVRGGDVHAYSNFKLQMEETGEASLDNLEQGTINRSAVIASVFLKGMHLDNNLVE